MSEKTIVLTCDNCSRLFPKRLAEFKRQSQSLRYHGKNYCCRQCYGQNLGNLHGFMAHPENKRHAKGIQYPCKYEYLCTRISELSQRGYSLKAVGNILCIPSPRSVVYSPSFQHMLIKHGIISRKIKHIEVTDDEIKHDNSR